MSEEKKVSEDALVKALDEIKKLAGGEDLVKGHNSRGTATTQVDSMTGEGGSTQVFHTPSNSDPNTWAGTSQYECPENGATDSVDENGTDLRGMSAMMKSVLELVSKGKLSAQDAMDLISKAGFDKDEDDKDEDKDKGDDKDKEELEKTKKSLTDAAQENTKLSEGFEVSDFLAEMTTEISKALENIREDLKSHVDSRLSKSMRSQEDFNKSLASAISDFSEVVTVQGQRLGQVEQAPARAPKTTNVQALNKSFSPGDSSEGEQLSKSQILDTMTDMVMKSQLSRDAVLKFDSTGQIDPGTYNAVVKYRNNG